jgi:predicted RNA-binding Zn-ribbon protein involved in translation (DUF1610 family)
MPDELDSVHPVVSEANNMIRFQCGKCGKQLILRDELAGQKGRCPNCRNVLEVPDLPVFENEKRKAGLIAFGIVAGLLLTIGAVVLVAFFLHSHPQKVVLSTGDSDDTTAKFVADTLRDYDRDSSESLIMSVTQLVDPFEENAIAAAKRYGKRKIILEGIVKRVEKKWDCNCITLGDRFVLGRPMRRNVFDAECLFPESADVDAAGAGHRIRVYGVVNKVYSTSVIVIGKRIEVDD